MKIPGLFLLGGVLSASLLIGGCGSSGGGSSAAEAADVNADNVNDLSVAAAEATKTAIDAENSGGGTGDVPTSFLFKSSNSAPLQQKLQSAVSSATSDPDFSNEMCPDGGSASYSANGDYTDFTFTFSNCKDNDYDTIFNGRVSMSGDIISGGATTITYNNFEVTSGGTTQTINGTITCTNGGMSCDYDNLTVGGANLSNADFSGDDGRQYSFEGDVNVGGDNTNGWSVNATVVDPDHGAITINAQNIIFGSCTNGVPIDGTITVTANNQTVTVEFIGCNSFSVTYDGSTTTVNWSDYGL